MRKVDLKLISVIIAFVILVFGLLIMSNNLAQASTIETKDGKAIDMLIEELTNNDLSISHETADKLASLGESAIPQLLKRLEGVSAPLKGQIVFILGRIGEKETTPRLMEILKDENAYIRRNAAEALGKIKDERAISVLATSLFDGDGGVRERSAWALGELRSPQAVESLIDRLKDEKEERVKSAIVNALGKLKDRSTTAMLIRELNSKSDHLYKNKVVASLGEIGDSRAIPELTGYLSRLREFKPNEPIVILQWEQAIKIVEEAIEKIQKRQ